MKLLSLDLSTKSTGYAVFEDNTLVDYGCIKASSTDVINRIQKIIKEINNVLLKHSNIEKIIVEEVRPENGQKGVGNLRTHKVLMWLQAALEFLIHDNFASISIEYLYPSEWRKVCGIQTGRGIMREKLKQADIDFVKKIYNIEVNDDIADAIGIGHSYVNKIDNEINWA